MKRIALIALLLAGGVACVTETGNPELQVHFEGQSTSVDVDLGSTARSAHLPVVVDEAWIHVAEVRLVEAEKCDSSREVERDIPGVSVDLLLGSDASVTSVPATDYCRVRLELENAPDNSTPAGLGGATAWLAGTLADGTPWTLRSEYEGRLDLRSRGEPFPLDEATAGLVVAFDISTWLLAVDFDQAELVGGTITVDDGSNEALLDQFEEALDGSVEVFDDADADGDRDDDTPIAD